MKKEVIISSIVGIIVGSLLVGATATLAVNNNNQSLMRMMGMRTTTDNQGIMHNSDMTMGEMSASLQGKSGDAFDEAFLSGMIAHHQGAIDMAKLVQANAKHDELKAMANDILSAQSKEITQMQTWQMQWGYAKTEQSHTMGH
ncbi:MAG TPA: DUF305 domain-containing protein [Candidatus Saccharimonadales bacterium]|nr:DUF305 domain-containing protein [Candidatus Saccharimonadales bacterium]